MLQAPQQLQNMHVAKQHTGGPYLHPNRNCLAMHAPHTLCNISTSPPCSNALMQRSEASSIRTDSLTGCCHTGVAGGVPGQGEGGEWGQGRA